MGGLQAEKERRLTIPLTRNFKDTVKARAERDPEFRVGLFVEAIEVLLSDDLETGKVLLRDWVRLMFLVDLISFFRASL